MPNGDGGNEVSRFVSLRQMLPSDYPGLYNSPRAPNESRKQAFFSERTWFEVGKTGKTWIAICGAMVVNRFAVQRELGTDFGMKKSFDRRAVHNDMHHLGAVLDEVKWHGAVRGVAFKSKLIG